MKLGAQLSEMVQKPLDCAQLPLTRESMNDEGSKFRFVVDEYQYEYDLTSEKLTKIGRAPAAPTLGAGQGRGGFGRGNFQQFQQQIQQQLQQLQQNQNQNQNEQQNQQVRQNNNQEQQNTTQQQNGRRGRGLGGRGGRGGAVAGRGGPTTRPNDYRNMSPDGSMYVYAYKHNLYLVVLKDAKKAEEKKADEKKSEETKKSDELGDYQPGADIYEKVGPPSHR